jgi:O-antigen/teichoic acid export membrane protein
LSSYFCSFAHKVGAAHAFILREIIANVKRTVRKEAQTWIERIRESSFIKNVTVLVSGTALAQALQFLVSPILSRLYDPAAFGLLGVFLATMGIVSVVAAAKYELSIVLPEDEGSAANLFVLSCAIVCGVSFVVLAGVAFGRAFFAQLIGEPGLAPYFWWLPLGILAAGLYQVFNYWATRRKHYTRLSISQGIRSAGTAGVQVPAGLLNGAAGGLIGGQVAGQVAATAVLGVQILKEDGRRIWEAVRFTGIRNQASQHSKFPKFTAPQSMVNAVSQNIPAYMLAAFFSPSVVGFYWFTHRLLSAPSRLVGEAVRKVFYQQVSEKYARGGSVYGNLWKTTAGLLGVGLVPTALILFAGPQLFSFAFGGEWQAAGVYAQWLTLWWLVGFVNVPSTMLVHVFGLQHLLLSYEVILAIARVLAIAVGAYIGDDVTSIMLFSIVGAAFNGAIIAFVFWQAKHRGKKNTFEQDQQLRSNRLTQDADEAEAFKQ